MPDRLTRRFAACAEQNRAALVTFVTAGDPDAATSAAILHALPAAGADVIELGVPFTDPMADGPAIQAANIRALAGGMTLARVLEMVRGFRAQDTDTPVILMGYFNPIFHYGVTRFAQDAQAAGVDGVIVVDVPPEEDAELGAPLRAVGLHVVRLATPTTDAQRQGAVCAAASGFLYYVSVAGITGGASGALDAIRAAVSRLRAASGLPVAVGFGIRTPEQAAGIARIADGVVVGSALVALAGEGPAAAATERVAAEVRALATAVRNARSAEAA